MKTTKVILCCIRPSDNSGIEISSLNLIQYFTNFGKVKDVEIFSRKVLIKAFIEFLDFESAQKALSFAYHRPAPFGNLKVYASKKDIVLRQDNTSQKFKFQFLNPRNLHTKSHVAHSLIPFLDPLSISQIKEKNSDDLKIQLSHFRININTNNDPLNPKNIPKNYEGDCFKTRLFPQNYSHDKTSQKSPSHSLTISSTEFRVLIINRINVEKVTPRYLVALFSCFGKVRKVLINLSLCYALVEFKNSQQANYACLHLKNVQCFGNNMKIKLSKYNSLNFHSLEKEQNGQLLFLYVDPKIFPNKHLLSYSIQEPSLALKFDFCPLRLSVFLLREMLAEVHLPENICTLPKDIAQTKSYLVSFGKLSQAFEILMIFDNQRIDEQKIVVSFARI